MPRAGADHTSRARAHYGWAQRYSKQGEAASSLAHLRRAVHYTGFGGDPGLKSWDEMFGRFTKFVVANQQIKKTAHEFHEKAAHYFSVADIDDPVRKKEYEGLLQDESNILSDATLHAKLPASYNEMVGKYGHNFELGFYEDGKIHVERFFDYKPRLDDYKDLVSMHAFMVRKHPSTPAPPRFYDKLLSSLRMPLPQPSEHDVSRVDVGSCRPDTSPFDFVNQEYVRRNEGADFNEDLNKALTTIREWGGPETRRATYTRALGLLLKVGEVWHGPNGFEDHTSRRDPTIIEASLRKSRTQVRTLVRFLVGGVKEHREQEWKVRTKREQCEFAYIYKTLADAAQLVYENTPPERPAYWTIETLLGIKREEIVQLEYAKHYIEREIYLDPGVNAQFKTYISMLREAA